MALSLKHSVLASHPLFAGCPDAAIAELAGRADAIVIRAGQLLFEMGDPGTRLHIIINGEIRLSVPSPEGKELTLANAGPGEVFGEIAVLDGGVRTARAVAVRETRLLAIERRELLDVMAQHPSIARRLLEIVCSHLRRSTEQIEELSFEVAPKRLVRAILRFARSQSSTICDGMAIVLTQRELAESIGLTRESTNRLLRDLERRDVLKLDKGRIVIRKSAELLRIANVTA